MHKTFLTGTAMSAAVLIAAASTTPVEAAGYANKGWRAVKRGGPYGKAGAIAGAINGGHAGAAAANWAGPRGGTIRGAVGGAWKKGHGGFGGGAYTATGPNGAQGQGAAGGAWKSGVGGKAFSQSSWVGPNGNTYNGYKNGGFDVQSQEGYYNSGKSGTYKGQEYGYSQETDFTKGQGGTTTIDSLNKNDYQIEWQKGTRPIITPIQGSTPESGSF